MFGEKNLKWPEWGQEDVFPTNPDLADILGRTDVDSDYSSQMSRFLDAGDDGVGRTLGSQLDPSPNAPRDQMHCKEPLLQQFARA